MSAVARAHQLVDEADVVDELVRGRIELGDVPDRGSGSGGDGGGGSSPPPPPEPHGRRLPDRPPRWLQMLIRAAAIVLLLAAAIWLAREPLEREEENS